MAGPAGADTHHLTALSPDFPPALRGIVPELWGRGAESAWQTLLSSGSPDARLAPRVTVVGSRAASDEGLRRAHELGAALAAAGAIVLSGGALGIDGAAHQGALSAAGQSWAILGSGLDNLYPQRHLPLFAGLQERGLLLSPFSLQDHMVRLIGRCADAAKAGQQARIVVKCNALTDEPLVKALIDAGEAGVDIDLIIRGACILPPGLPGLTDRIRVRSVVGRMLEHTRVLYFRWGEADYEESLYLSSADWMNRNMTRRIEVAWPVRDPALRQRVIDECLVPYLHDGIDAWQQLSDGRYDRIHLPNGHSAQRALMARYQAQD